MKKYFPLFFIFIISIYAVQFIGCAPSKPPTESAESTDEDDMGEIERLLGISEEDKQPKEKKAEKKQATNQDDDLLTLLKADEDKGTTKPTGTQSGGDPRLKHLQQQVQDLESQLEEKNRTIADLKAQVMMKDEELKNYQSGQSTTTTTPQRSSTQYYSSGGGGGSPYEQDYQRGLDLFHSNQYRDAIAVFESLLSQNRSHSLSDNAQYWIGECNYALGSYRAAILAFEKVFTFTQSNKNDYAQYKLGLCYYQMGDYARAGEEFQNLIDNYSNPELVNRAYDYLAQIDGQ